MYVVILWYGCKDIYTLHTLFCIDIFLDDKKLKSWMGVTVFFFSINSFIQNIMKSSKNLLT